MNNDVLGLIFSLLYKPDHIRCTTVCKLWYNIVQKYLLLPYICKTTLKLSSKRLMFHEVDRILSLAVRVT